MYLNRVFLIGNLTQDPELKNLPSGSSVANFGLATNRTYTDKAGARQESTEYHSVVAYGKQADIISQYLKKGSLMMVEGRIQTRSWEAQDGQKKYKTEVIIENFQMGPKGSSGGGSQGGNSYSGGSSAPKNQRQAPQQQEELPTVDLDEDEIDLEEIPF